jgi:hypothetical protein
VVGLSQSASAAIVTRTFFIDEHAARYTSAGNNFTAGFVALCAAEDPGVVCTGAVGSPNTSDAVQFLGGTNLNYLSQFTNADPATPGDNADVGIMGTLNCNAANTVCLGEPGVENGLQTGLYKPNAGEPGFNAHPNSTVVVRSSLRAMRRNLHMCCCWVWV